MNKISVGQAGEKAAAIFLKGNGYKILETNFKCKFGEVDIVAQEGDTLVFVEVKTRSSREFGLPVEAVGKKKLSHIASVAAYYRLVRKNLPPGDRIDVVAIEVAPGGQVTNIELIQNASG